METFAGPAAEIVIDTGTETDRQRVEAIVKDALRHRPRSEPWMIVLHELRPGWTVFIDGPDQALCAEIKHRLSAAGYAPIPGPCPE